MRRPSAPLVISVIALFAALGGTSYAAVKITGKEIAKKTIKGGNVANKTLGAKKVKPDTLGGKQINESKLGPVPSADHASSADTAATAANADKLDGLDSTDFMRNLPRAFEANHGTINNFPSDSPLATLNAVPAGTYVVTARLTYDNDGATGESETCTLDVPGANDVVEFYSDTTDVISLQEVVTSAAPFSPYVHCSSDGNDDMLGTLSIIATRVDG
jgi:hypothetical protein